MTTLPRNTAPESLPAATATAAAPARASTALGRMLPVEVMEAFPGRWVGGVAMVLGPLLMLAGALVRVRSDFFFPLNLPRTNMIPG